MKRPRKAIKRSALKPRRTPVKRSNPKRKAAAFVQAYGSKSRVEFVKSLPCSVTDSGAFHGGAMENAHTLNNGMGRKGPASSCIPLCSAHHFMSHVLGARTFQTMYCIDFATIAAETERLWQAARARQDGDA